MESMPITLPEHTIHLWFVHTNRINDAALLKQYQALMSIEEQERNQRFIFEKDQKRHLITRALIRSVLSEYDPSIAPQDWCFTENGYGKPQVLPALLKRPLSFNLSHSGNMIALAISREPELGIDIESLNPNTPNDDLAKHAFAPTEYQQLKDLTSDDFYSRFYDFWTLKEAYIKACGLGLSIPLDSFSFSFEQANIKINFDESRKDHPEHWQFWQITPNPDYKVALAIKSGKEKISSEQIVIREVIPLECAHRRLG